MGEGESEKEDEAYGSGRGTLAFEQMLERNTQMKMKYVIVDARIQCRTYNEFIREYLNTVHTPTTASMEHFARIADEMPWRQIPKRKAMRPRCVLHCLFSFSLSLCVVCVYTNKSHNNDFGRTTTRTSYTLCISFTCHLLTQWHRVLYIVVRKFVVHTVPSTRTQKLITVTMESFVQWIN